MQRMTRLIVALFALALLAAACGDKENAPAMSGDVVEPEPTVIEDEAAPSASASFTAPESGATVARRFEVAMDATGIEIEPAGEARDGAGHFHVIVDAGCMEPGEVIPSDAQHVHFGKAQTEGQLFLEPGDHELCLQVADGTHVALDVTDEITVTVDPDQPYVSLEVPAGDTVASPVPITMLANGVAVEPAGEVRDGAGHFHVTIDADCVEPGEVIPSDDQHRHFGDGSTTATLDLAPGSHTLCLQLGDGVHAALPLTHLVTVVVG